MIECRYHRPLRDDCFVSHEEISAPAIGRNSTPEKKYMVYDTIIPSLGTGLCVVANIIRRSKISMIPAIDAYSAINLMIRVVATSLVPSMMEYDAG